MATITAATLQTLLGITLTETTCEVIIDQAIDLINLYGRTDLANMGGTAGSKTLSLDSREKGAVLDVAAAVYSNMYVSGGSESTSFSIGGISSSSSSSASNMAIKSAAKDAARLLAEIEVDIG